MKSCDFLMIFSYLQFGFAHCTRVAATNGWFQLLLLASVADAPRASLQWNAQDAKQWKASERRDLTAFLLLADVTGLLINWKLNPRPFQLLINVITDNTGFKRMENGIRTYSSNFQCLFYILCSSWEEWGMSRLFSMMKQGGGRAEQ